MKCNGPFSFGKNVFILTQSVLKLKKIKHETQKEERWKCHIRYKEQDYFSSFLSMQKTNRCRLTALA